MQTKSMTRAADVSKAARHFLRQTRKFVIGEIRDEETAKSPSGRRSQGIS